MLRRPQGIAQKRCAQAPRGGREQPLFGFCTQHLASGERRPGDGIKAGLLPGCSGVLIWGRAGSHVGLTLSPALSPQ